MALLLILSCGPNNDALMCSYQDKGLVGFVLTGSLKGRDKREKFREVA